MKLGAELSEDVTEVTEASGCGGGTGGTDWIGWGSGAIEDSLGGFATGSGTGCTTGSLDRRVWTRCVATRKKITHGLGSTISSPPMLRLPNCMPTFSRPGSKLFGSVTA